MLSCSFFESFAMYFKTLIIIIFILIKTTNILYSNALNIRYPLSKKIFKTIINLMKDYNNKRKLKYFSMNVQIDIT